ncbi:protoporphyrinogen/coproporphyrinogen oxidase [Pseudomonas sp. BGr12]|uniref:protoporphyrinogen/coproporphyrinogen oxidase n=1 Tax=Pseudomonas sp. BGr12 TaxID=2936269 RepID=UPI0025595655|nr:FAD-dependent oxidoreductase [Pseudomonas sp. BJa5]MDL2428431.1 FAD-dependent oxidoreductase [Pseudomonas sp. BJa5]
MDKNKMFSRRDTLKFGAMAIAVSAVGFSGLTFSSNKRSAVVIGSGIAGLSAAYELKKAGFDVVVMEKWDFVGGRMRDAKIGPFQLMPHALGVLQDTHEIHSLAKEVGIADQFSGEADADLYYMNNGVGTYPISLKFDASQVAQIPGMSKETIARLPLLQKELDEIRKKVDPSLMASGAYLDNETVAQYFTRVLGPDAANQFMDYWVDPFLDAWGLTRNESSSVPVIAWMAHGQGTKTPRGGIGVLTRKLGELIPVQFRTTVRYITPPDKDGKHTVHYLNSNLEKKSVTPDVVVCATEGKFIPELVQGLSEKQSRLFKSIDFTKSISVRFALSPDGAPKELVGDAYTQTHPDPTKRKIWFWYAAPQGYDHKDNPAYISVVMQRSENGNWQRSGLSQPDYCLKFLREVYPDLDESKITSAVTLGCDDLVHMQPGYIKNMAEVLDEQNSSKHGLYFAGEYLAGGHTAAACASGRTTARTIISHWS